MVYDEEGEMDHDEFISSKKILNECLGAENIINITNGPVPQNSNTCTLL